MKKIIAISALVSATIFGSNPSFAKGSASTEENVGFASGAIAGAAIGGPVGFFVGAIGGILIGEQVEKANELDQVKAELELANQTRSQLENEMAHMQASFQDDDSDTSWLTAGLTMNVMFTTDSSSLSDADVAAIKRLASVLNEFPGLSIQLDGYADPRGNSEHNMKLSQSRVDAVRAKFAQFGIDGARVIATAHGEMQGLSNEAGLDAYAMARKVSVNFTNMPTDQVAQADF